MVHVVVLQQMEWNGMEWNGERRGEQGRGDGWAGQDRAGHERPVAGQGMAGQARPGQPNGIRMCADGWGGVTRNKDNKAKQKHCSITEVIHTWCISKECYCDGGRFTPGGEKRMLGDAGLIYILGKHKILFLLRERESPCNIRDKDV